ncbi:hypothetical protein OGAPHI_003846 [Ogataea philodendri]|uniref:Uncharacterized protein n=1 Tax=Ogataea philodendri TaxID=1378263 RepID=A0A9P8T477_9ASCO|nr:uncharacterized protein OGAPHI_003846 [Ogataea philodendri]KAH3665658.1 hypothetical protein OGAPHI_003846 [Ogataea philodendri]
MISETGLSNPVDRLCARICWWLAIWWWNPLAVMRPSEVAPAPLHRAQSSNERPNSLAAVPRATNASLYAAAVRTRSRQLPIVSLKSFFVIKVSRSSVEGVIDGCDDKNESDRSFCEWIFWCTSSSDMPAKSNSELLVETFGTSLWSVEVSNWAGESPWPSTNE